MLDPPAVARGRARAPGPRARPGWSTSAAIVGGLGLLRGRAAGRAGVRGRRPARAAATSRWSPRTAARPAHLRRIVLADGVVLGLAGAVVGVALGIARRVRRPPARRGLPGERAGRWLPGLPGRAARRRRARPADRRARGAGAGVHRGPAGRRGGADRPARRDPLAQAAVDRRRARAGGRRRGARRPGRLRRSGSWSSSPGWWSASWAWCCARRRWSASSPGSGRSLPLAPRIALRDTPATGPPRRRRSPR